MNYTELVTEIQSYTENSFVTADINTFIEQAEQRVYNSIQLPAFRRNCIGQMTAGYKYIIIPDGWLSTFSMAVIGLVNGVPSQNGEFTYLLNKDVNFIRQAYPSPNDTGIPEYYAVFDERSFILGPTPDADYYTEMHYYYYPTSITVAGTSWLGDNFDSVLLYGSLLEAYTYMKGEQDIITIYKQRYDEAMALLKQLGDGKDRGDAYRDGQVRYPVT